MNQPNLPQEGHEPLPQPSTSEKSTSDEMVANIVGPVTVHELLAPPKISTAEMRPGDRLELNFRDDTKNLLTVKNVWVEDTSFGSDELVSPKCLVECGGLEHELNGSSIFREQFFSPGVIGAGSYVQSSMYENGTSPAILSEFRLLRADPTTGEYAAADINVAEQGEPSATYKQMAARFAVAKGQLEDKGFDFNADDGIGFGASYGARTDEKIVFATRERGSEDEIFMYDSAQEKLVAMRTLRTGQIQAAVIAGVTKDAFQFATRAYTGEQPDWHNPMSISKAVLHRLGRNVPFVTYTWLKPTQAQPIIHVNLSETDKPIGSFNFSDKYGEEFTGHPLAIDIAFDETAVKVRAVEPDYRVKNPEQYKVDLLAGLDIRQQGGRLHIAYREAELSIPADPLDEINNIIFALRDTALEEYKRLGDSWFFD